MKDERDIILTNEYKKLIEEKELNKKKVEEGKQKSLATKEIKNDEFLNDDDILGRDTLKNKLLYSEGILERVKRNEDLKNIILQRSDVEIEKLPHCSSALSNFTNDICSNFGKSTLLSSNFSPCLDLNLSLVGSNGILYSKQNQVNPLDAIRLAINREKSASTKSHPTIFACDIIGKTEKEKKKILELMQNGYDFNDSLLKMEEGGIRLGLKERILLIKAHLHNLKGLQRSRKKILASLSQKDISPLFNNKDQQSDNFNGSSSNSQTLSKKIKYLVNMGLINKRKDISKQEILERRYQMMSIST